MPSQAQTYRGWFAMLVLACAVVSSAASQLLAGPEDLGLPLRRAQSVDEAALESIGVTADPASINAFLAEVYADHGEGGRVAKLIAELGARDYRERQQATARLAISSVVSDAALREAAENHVDPEVRLRARQALAQREEQGGGNPVMTVFRYIGAHDVAGAAGMIIRVLSRIEDEALWPYAFYAVAASADAADAATFDGMIDAESERVRSLALLGRCLVDGDRGVARAVAALDEKAPRMRLAAGWALLKRGDARGLGALAELLAHDEEVVRRVAVQGLRSASGQRFGYASSMAPAKQGEAIGQWRRWAAERGADAELEAPKAVFGSGPRFNRILLARFRRNAVEEYDNAGKLVWRETVNTPYGVQGLPNGHRLVGSFNEEAVYEFDDKGEKVWSVTDLPGGAMGVERLDNGNTLIACSDGQVVMEVDKNGQPVWQARIDGRPTQAQRLPNKRTLVCLSDAGKVVEISPAGKVVWSIDGLKNPQSAVRLGNGDTLVTLAGDGKVVRYTPAGEPVRSWGGLQVPLHAEMTEGGEVLAIEQQRGLAVLDNDDNHPLRISIANEQPVLARFHRY